MKLSRASGYAVLAVLAIAHHQRKDPGGVVQIKDIAAEFDLSQEYIAKLLTVLVKARILNSGRGRHGGFTLRQRASETTILDIVEAVDGPLETVNLLSRVGGDEQVRENVGAMFDGALEGLRRVLAARSIDQLMH